MRRYSESSQLLIERVQCTCKLGITADTLGVNSLQSTPSLATASRAAHWELQRAPFLLADNESFQVHEEITVHLRMTELSIFLWNYFNCILYFRSGDFSLQSSNLMRFQSSHHLVMISYFQIYIQQQSRDDALQAISVVFIFVGGFFFSTPILPHIQCH